MSAKLVPTFAGRGVSRGQRNGSPRPLIIFASSWFIYITFPCYNCRFRQKDKEFYSTSILVSLPGNRQILSVSVRRKGYRNVVLEGGDHRRMKYTAWLKGSFARYEVIVAVTIPRVSWKNLSTFRRNLLLPFSG